MGRIQQSNDHVRITIEDTSNEYDEQELTTAAIVSLIEGANTDWWMKDAINAGEDDSTLRFYESVLTAIANHWAVDDERLEGKPIHEALIQMIQDFRDLGFLQDPTVGIIPDDEGE